MSKQNRISRQELRKAQQEAALKAARRRRLVMVLGVGVILALVVAIVFVIVQATGGDDDGGGAVDTSGPVVTPENLNADGGIAVGDDTAPVTVTLYVDYMCPACGAFEEANGPELDRLMEAGTVQLDLRPISFLDRASNGTQFSTRAANAIWTTTDASPNDVWAFHKALYADQPEEGSDGLDNDRIAAIAEDAGVPADVVDTFTDYRFGSWVADFTEKAFEDDGVEGTPTILINGETFEGDAYSVGPLTEAIEKAAG